MTNLTEVKIIKRDGRVVSWDPFRIQHAIFRAAIFGKYSQNSLSANMLANTVTKAVEDNISSLKFDKIEIDVIQNAVVKALTQKDKDVANDFLAYKTEKDIERVKR